VTLRSSLEVATGDQRQGQRPDQPEADDGSHIGGTSGITTTGPSVPGVSCRPCVEVSLPVLPHRVGGDRRSAYDSVRQPGKPAPLIRTTGMRVGGLGGTV
jgi:hypothetical protein